MDWSSVADKYGWPVLATVLLIVGGIREYYVWGWQYRQMKVERDLYRDMVITSIRALEEAVEILKTMRRSE